MIRHGRDLPEAVKCGEPGLSEYRTLERTFMDVEVASLTLHK